MTAFSSSARRILANLAQQHTGRATTPDMLEPVVSGASGRSIMRVHGLMAIHWTGIRADNNSFLPAAHGLAAAGIRVPAIAAELSLPDACGACLTEDLGKIDLLSLKTAPEEEILDAYRRAIDTLIPFWQLKPDWELQPAFDTAMYRWEQEYFAEHFIGRHLGLKSDDFLNQSALQDMAEWLAALPRVPVHRDCQSQNIMLKDGQAWLIDFQGMRMGLAEYDLAALLYDPYMELGLNTRLEILRYWSEQSGQPLRTDIFAACAMQRLMQALGAFANIGHNMDKAWYLKQIPAALTALRHVIDNTQPGSPATAAAACLHHVVK